MHRERARSREPALVSRALEQREEGVAVPGRAMAEARALPQRPGLPRELAARDRELLVEEVARASRRSPARRGTTGCGSGRRRCASSRCMPAYGSQLTSPSSSTAKGSSVSETSPTSPSASTQPANPCAGPMPRVACPKSCCVHRPSESRRPCSHSMLDVTSSPSSRPARIVPGLPNINSHRSSCSFAAISSASRARLASDGA